MKTLNKYSQNNSEAMYDAFVQAPVAICIFRGRDYILDFANDFYLQLIGKQTDIIGTSICESFPELINQGLKELINGVVEIGKTFYINEHEMRIFKNSVEEIRFFNCSYQPYRDKNNQFTSTIVVLPK